MPNISTVIPDETETDSSQTNHPLKDLLVNELRDLLHAEGQLVAARTPSR